jgi:hypothetical protein
MCHELWPGKVPDETGKVGSETVRFRAPGGKAGRPAAGAAPYWVRH